MHSKLIFNDFFQFIKFWKFTCSTFRPWLRGWHIFGPLVYLDEKLNDWFFFKYTKKSCFEIENKITSQKLILVESCYFFISWRIFSYYYYLLIKVNHNCLWHNGASLAFYWREFLPSLWQFFQKEFDSQVTQLVGPQSNDLMQPTALVQTCSLPVVSTCFCTGPKLYHPLNYHSLSTP